MNLFKGEEGRWVLFNVGVFEVVRWGLKFVGSFEGYKGFRVSGCVVNQ